jgi:anti-sigma regulatory factor (Ser/Thr protein kinase)
MPMTSADEQREALLRHLVKDTNCIGGDLPAIAASVSALRTLVTEFARSHGADDAALWRIGLAVAEAAANVVVHAYTDHIVPGTLRFAADVQAGEDDLQIVISDTGAGLRADHESPGFGQGLRLIASVTNDFSIGQVQPHGVEIWMRFLFGGAA